ncbi:MAG: hypothetical protein HN700_19655, partial [Verrucomicrobia bacterium]|nr:hypothetical protein [Verrucomicrobiota bacterium]
MLRILPLMALGISVLFLTAYGAGIYPWTVCAVLFALSVANLAVYAKPRSTALFQKRRLTLPALYAALLIFIAIVLMPLPLSLSRLTGSLRFEQNTCVAETLEEAKALGIETPPLVTFSTSRSRAGTLRALLLLATLFGAWKLAQQLDPALRQLWLRGLIGLGSVVAVLGHLGKWVIPQGNTLWWAIPVPPVLPGPVGGFINPNHFAGFVALLAPVALAMGIADARQRRWGCMLTDIAGFTLMTVALLFSMSRGGVVAYVGGIGVLMLLVFLRSSKRVKAAL